MLCKKNKKKREKLLLYFKVNLLTRNLFVDSKNILQDNCFSINGPTKQKQS